MLFLVCSLLLFQGAAGVVHFFTPDELRYTFGVSNVTDVPKYDEVFPEFEYGPCGELTRIRFAINGSAYDLPLESTVDKLIGDRIVSVHRSDEANGMSLDKPQSCHYRFMGNGTLAAISNCDGRIKGTIVDSNGIHVIHPFPDRHAHRSKRAADNKHGVHIVYKREALTNQVADDFCGIDSVVSEEQLLEDETAIFEDVFVTGQKLVQQSDLVVELAVFIDETLWRHFSSKYGGSAHSRMQDYTLTLLNNIQIMYYQPTASPPLTFRVIRYEVLSSQPAALAANLHNHGNAQMYLDRFCRYQRNLGVRDWDHAILLTGYDIHRGAGSRSISGIARLDGMCDPWNTCTLAEGLDFTSAFIGTHELGHSVGMRHDEPYCPSKHIMSSSLGPGKVTWSTCSLRDYHQFLQKLDARGRNCLRVTNMPTKMNIPVGSKPGQIYDANKQCELMHGVGYTQVTPRVDNYDGICYMMWCGQSSFGRIITSHPALEGTFCGPNKWCELGRCVPWSGQRSQPSAPAPAAAPAPAPAPSFVTPRKTDGGWSDFSSHNCNACSCNQLSGGIGLTRATRTCSNPYPSNGGAECFGSNTRALICNRQCPAQRKTVDQYISDKCAEHKRLKNDQELTGGGSQLNRYPQRACKVFCDVQNRFGGQRNYRFFGDNLPDGTTCGYEKYCLDGECLSLSCNNNALIGRDQACPTQSCPANNRAPPAAQNPRWKGQWGVWSLWTECSVSCGSGYRKRSRTCSLSGYCDGSDTEQEQCNRQACPANTGTGSSWTAWTDWNQCSVSCGRGSQARYRKCVTPQNTLAFNCPDKNIDVRQCDAGSCDGVGIWGPWATWSTCSTSCGPGMMVRQRSCQREPCDGSGNERRSCNVATCASAGQWSSWNGWTECSRLCGRGLRSRSRQPHPSEPRCVCENGRVVGLAPGRPAARAVTTRTLAPVRRAPTRTTRRYAPTRAPPSRPRAGVQRYFVHVPGRSAHVETPDAVQADNTPLGEPVMARVAREVAPSRSSATSRSAPRRLAESGPAGLRGARAVSAAGPESSGGRATAAAATAPDSSRSRRSATSETARARTPRGEDGATGLRVRRAAARVSASASASATVAALVEATSTSTTRVLYARADAPSLL